MLKELLPQLQKLVADQDEKLLSFLKNLRRQKKYIWFQSQTPNQIYQDNFHLISEEFEKSFKTKYMSQSTIQESTLDSHP